MNYVNLKIWGSFACVAFSLGLSNIAAADQQKKPERKTIQEKNETPRVVMVSAEPQEEKRPPSDIPVYKPPKRGAPGGRIAGGSRGPEGEFLVLSVVAPEDTGLTVEEQPFLYWYLARPTNQPVEFTIIDDKSIQPLVEVRLNSPVQAGVHRIRLADHNVRLSPGVLYKWFIAVVPDDTRRSKDILSGGAIERIEVPEELRLKLAQTGKAKLPFLYAEAGLWYDTIVAISELIESAPNDPLYRKQRASLLAQVGLPKIEE